MPWPHTEGIILPRRELLRCKHKTYRAAFAGYRFRDVVLGLVVRFFSPHRLAFPTIPALPQSAPLSAAVQRQSYPSAWPRCAAVSSPPSLILNPSLFLSLCLCSFERRLHACEPYGDGAYGQRACSL
jgi:hypothetical protein